MTTQEYAISLPFRIGLSGNVESTTDQSAIWGARVLTVLGTAISERVQRYYFGSKIHFELFMTQEDAESKIKEAIGNAFGDYLPLLTLDNVATDFNAYEGTLSVRVYYRLPNNSKQSTLLGNILLDRNFPAQES